MKESSRLWALAIPIPALPPGFINLLSVININQSEIVEGLLSAQIDNRLKNKEGLVICCLFQYQY